MDREKLVDTLNSYVNERDYTSAKTLVDEFLGDAKISQRDDKIDALLRNPFYAEAVINHTINELCLKYQINYLSKNNQIILFIK